MAGAELGDGVAVLGLGGELAHPGRADMDFSLGFWVWSFLGAPYSVPERLIGGAPEVVVNHVLSAWWDRAGVFPADVRAAYTGQFRDPGRVHAICEQYRAAATLDYQHDQADRGRRLITCPTLVLWSQTGPVAGWHQPLEVGPSPGPIT